MLVTLQVKLAITRTENANPPKRREGYRLWLVCLGSVWRARNVSTFGHTALEARQFRDNAVAMELGCDSDWGVCPHWYRLRGGGYYDTRVHGPGPDPRQSSAWRCTD